MKLNKRMRTTSILAIGLGAVGAGVVATPANAALNAYDSASYVGLLASSTLKYIDVDDDRTSSIKNTTSYYYSAQYTVGLVGYTMFTMNPNTNIAALSGSQNNSIDHFIR